MKKQLVRTLGLALLGVWIWGGQMKEAEAWGTVPRGVELEAPHIGFVPFGLGGAAGIRFNIPLTRRGLIPNFPDALYFGVGVDAYYTDYDKRYGIGLGVPLVVQWSFFFTNIFSLYLELGINVWFHEGFFAGRPLFFSPSWLMGAIGFRFHIAKNVAIQIRAGAPYSSLGISFYF